MKKVYLILCSIALVMIVACGGEVDDVLNLPPSALIIAPELVGINQEVTLNGQGSLDPEGETLTYSWILADQPTGSNATLTDANTAIASFTTDVEGNYTVNLSVSDGNQSGEESITIIASSGANPTAMITNADSREITEDNNVFRPNEEFILSGQTSFDLEDGLTLATYQWEITQQPDGSVPMLVNAATNEATFSSETVGIYTIQLTVTDSDGNAGIAEANLEVKRIPILLTQDISANETLANVYEDSKYLDYLVPTSQSIISITADLTINEGVSIGFQENTGMIVTSGGSINAIGTSTDSIVFKGEESTKGFWRGLLITSNNTSNVLSFIEISGGGSNGFDGAGLKANITLQNDGKLTLTNSTISNADGNGLLIRSAESELVNFTNNIIKENTIPISSLVNHYHFFDSGSDYTGNTNDYINTSSRTTTDQDVTWNKLNVPYRLATGVTSISSNIIIEPGAEFLGISEAGIFITENGSLNATGTMDAPIIFRGENDTEGSWRGLSFESNNASNQLIHTQVSNGGQRGFDGANLKANVMVEGNGRLVIQSSTITKSDDVGVYLRNDDSKLPDFTNNTISNNNVPVRISPINWHYMDSESDYSGNTNDYIDGFRSRSSINQMVTWNSLNVPYRIPNNVETIIGGGVTVAAGTNFISSTDGGLQSSQDGFLQVNGTASNPVTFAGEQNVSGFWRGLRFDSRNANNIVTFTTVSNGGSRGFDGANRRANIEVGRNGLLNLDNITINLSGGFGIRVQRDGTLVSSNLTFTDNSSGDSQDDN